jgi:hypothetical protein
LGQIFVALICLALQTAARISITFLLHVCSCLSPSIARVEDLLLDTVVSTTLCKPLLYIPRVSGSIFVTLTSHTMLIIVPLWPAGIYEWHLQLVQQDADIRSLADVDQLQVLTKSLLPLPDKWHGLTDIEKRYR